MRIRDDHMAVMEQSAILAFENELVAHMRQFAPRHAEVIGEARVRSVVQSGLRRAEVHGFVQRGPARFYVELMFMFGSEFETDPQLRWTGEALGGEHLTDPLVKADRLHDRMSDYLDVVAGPDNIYALEAMRRLRSMRLEDLTPMGSAFVDRMLAGLRQVYPEKFGYAGDAVLRGLIQRGISSASSFGLAPEKGAALLTALMFAAGHGVTHDLLFPWVSAALADPLLQNPVARTERLHDRAMAYLGRAVQYLEQRK